MQSCRIFQSFFIVTANLIISQLLVSICDGTVNWATNYGWISSRGNSSFFSLSLLSPPSCLSCGYWELFPQGVKQPRREADRSPTSSVEVNITWSYTSTSIYVFITSKTLPLASSSETRCVFRLLLRKRRACAATCLACMPAG
jgi:hypothetical protein